MLRFHQILQQIQMFLERVGVARLGVRWVARLGVRLVGRLEVHLEDRLVGRLEDR